MQRTASKLLISKTKFAKWSCNGFFMSSLRWLWVVYYWVKGSNLYLLDFNLNKSYLLLISKVLSDKTWFLNSMWDLWLYYFNEQISGDEKSFCKIIQVILELLYKEYDKYLICFKMSHLLAISSDLSSLFSQTDTFYSVLHSWFL